MQDVGLELSIAYRATPKKRVQIGAHNSEEINPSDW